MTLRLKPAQRGISFIGLLFVAAVVGVSGVIAAQVFPTFIEYQAILKATRKAATEGGSSVAEVRAVFDRAAAVDNVSSIAGRDLVVAKEGDKVVVSFSYNREIHLAGPAFLLLKYNGRSR